MNDDRDLKWTIEPDDESAADPGTGELLEALKRAGRGPQPPAGFVNKLNRELQKVHKMQNETLWYQLKRWLPAAAGAGVVMVAVVIAIFIIPQYLRSTTELEPVTDTNVITLADGQQTEAISGAETVTDAAGGDSDAEEEAAAEDIRLGGSNAAQSGLAFGPPTADSSYYPYPGGTAERPTYELAIDLNDQPGVATKYQLVQSILPSEVDDVISWAADFGIPNPQVYTSAEEYDTSFTIIGSSGERIHLNHGEGFSDAYYSNPNVSREAPGERLASEEAVTIARAWWVSHGFDMTNYLIDVEPYSAAYPDPTGVYNLRIRPVVEGVAIEGWIAAGDMTINSRGEVIHARIPGWNLVPVGQQTAISQQEAYDAMVNGGRSINYFYKPVVTTVESFERPLSFTPQATRYESGATVTLQGWPTILQNAEDGSYYVEFYDYSGTLFVLTGDQVENFAQNWDYEDISVTGTITAVIDGNAATMELASWEISEHYYGGFIECFMGTIAADGTFTSDSGISLQVENVPEALPADYQVEICGEVGDDDLIEWVHITGLQDSVLPYPEDSFVGPVYHTEYGYDQEQYYGEFVEPAFLEDPFGPDVPYVVGDTVSFAGQLFGTILKSSDDSLRYELYLNGSLDDTPTGTFWGVRLYGDKALLAEISEFHANFVRVEGEIIQGEGNGYGPGEPGILVTGYEALSEVSVQGHFGKMEFRELDDRLVMVFVDETSGAEFAIDPSYPAEPEYFPEFTNENFERIWVALTVHPYWEFAGLQVAQMSDVRYGREVDQLEDPSTLLEDYYKEIQIQPDYLEFAGENFFPFTGNFVIERVELGYTAEPGFANPYFSEPGSADPIYSTPVWIFYGTDRETGASITVQVDATAPEG